MREADAGCAIGGAMELARAGLRLLGLLGLLRLLRLLDLARCRMPYAVDGRIQLIAFYLRVQARFDHDFDLIREIRV
jgi:hypothetical protein